MKLFLIASLVALVGCKSAPDKLIADVYFDKRIRYSEHLHFSAYLQKLAGLDTTKRSSDSMEMRISYWYGNQAIENNKCTLIVIKGRTDNWKTSSFLFSLRSQHDSLFDIVKEHQLRVYGSIDSLVTGLFRFDLLKSFPALRQQRDAMDDGAYLHIEVFDKNRYRVLGCGRPELYSESDRQQLDGILKLIQQTFPEFVWP